MPIFAVLCVAFCAAAAASNQCEGETLRLVNDLRKEFEEKLQKKEDDLTLLFNEKLLNVEAKLQEEIRKQHHEGKEDTSLLKRSTNDSDLEIRVDTLEEKVDELENYIFLINSQLTATQTEVAAVIKNLAVVQEEILDFNATDADLRAGMDVLADRGKQTEESVINGERYAFLASLTSHADSGFVVFDRVRYNQGSVYDPSRGVFTAPIDGIYHLSSQMFMDNSGGFMRVRFYVNGVYTYMTEHETASTDGDGVTATTVTDLQLSAGDEVTVGTCSVTTVWGNVGDLIYSSFSGHLIQAL